MKFNHFLFFVFLIGIQNCFPEDFNKMLSSLKKYEDIHFFPASVEAIEYTYQLFLNDLEIERNTSLKGDKTPDEISEIIQIYIKIYSNGIYHIWSMTDKEHFTKLLDKYGSAPLVFLSSSESLDEYGLIIQISKGYGILEGTNIKLLHMSEDSRITPSIFEYDAKEEEVSLATLSKEEMAILRDWNRYIKEIDKKCISLDIKEKEYISDLEISKANVIAIASFPFIEYLNEYFRDKYFAFLLIEQKYCSDMKHGMFKQDFDDFIRKMKNELVLNPLGMSSYQWNIIKRETNMTSKLYYYKKDIEINKDVPLLTETGFVIKKDEKIMRRIPLEITIFNCNFEE